MTARIARDDPDTFCLFVISHRLPRIDQAVMDDGTLRSVPVQVTR
jgi:hypothetical protein